MKKLLLVLTMLYTTTVMPTLCEVARFSSVTSGATCATLGGYYTLLGLVEIMAKEKAKDIMGFRGPSLSGLRSIAAGTTLMICGVSTAMLSLTPEYKCGQ